jgi:hypothetical protein
MVISEQEWRFWTRGHVNDSREFTLSRKVGEGFDWLKSNWRGTDEYAAIFSRQQIDAGKFDTILFDIDAHDGEDWHSKVQQVLSKVDVKPSRVYATGRGAHVYFDLETPVEGVGKYKQVVGALVKKWGIKELIDERVIGDVRRMARLPMSKNSKGGYMVRLPVEAIDIPVGGEPETLAYEEPRTVVVVIGEAKGTEQKFGPVLGVKNLYSEAEYPPCIRAGIKQLKDTGELDHAQRLHVFSYLVGNDEMDKAYNILKTWARDFNSGISTYQLNYLAKGHDGHPVKPFKCANVPADLCPYVNQRECVYWPSVNLHRQRLLEQGVL